MNPTAPKFHATIKLHKENTPIRPIINWRNAPAYELAKTTNKNITQLRTPTEYIQHPKLCTPDLGFTIHRN
jgi:hypothetical protein